MRLLRCLLLIISASGKRLLIRTCSSLDLHKLSLKKFNLLCWTKKCQISLMPMVCPKGFISKFTYDLDLISINVPMIYMTHILCWTEILKFKRSVLYFISYCFCLTHSMLRSEGKNFVKANLSRMSRESQPENLF